LPTIAWEIKDKNLDSDKNKYVTEWEKSKLKPIFRSYDKGKIFYNKVFILKIIKIDKKA
jgi:hypothetical protein